MQLRLKRWLFLTHRWLGIVLCVFFALWFISGVVMMYVGYPKLTSAERLAHLPSLGDGAGLLAPRQALEKAGIEGPLKELRLAAGRGGQAVYLVVPESPPSDATGRRRTPPGSGTVVVGIHIAAPGLAVQPDSPLDQLARTRLSTVYMPGHKITMLPDEVVNTYTLEAGRDCPAVSLYVSFDEATLTVQDSRTALERVPIAHNLRHDKLDAFITPAWLDGEASDATPPEIAGLQPQLAFLWRLARHLKARREVVRGKPENFTRPDYTFKLEGVQGSEPDGTERVVIGTRSRGAPLDLMVAEAMILANSTWGQWLADCGVPGIYRSQASLAPGIKVRMGTKAQPHAGIGVPCYAWSTSPLRRYVDLVNQWQIIACARHGKTAALAAPFKPKDANLFSVISAFDAAYAAYNGFQGGMERFWTLQYLRQNGITELTASLIRDDLVRADNLPLVMQVLGGDGLPRGAHVRVRLGQSDDITLEVHGTVIERLDTPADTPADAAADDTAEADDDEALAAPIALAIDVNETDNPAPAAGSSENG